MVPSKPMDLVRIPKSFTKKSPEPVDSLASNRKCFPYPAERQKRDRRPAFRRSRIGQEHRRAQNGEMRLTEKAPTQRSKQNRRCNADRVLWPRTQSAFSCELGTVANTAAHNTKRVQATLCAGMQLVHACFSCSTFSPSALRVEVRRRQLRSSSRT
eukprot:1012827-Pleurochrysis_carterae.AAC.4